MIKGTTTSFKFYVPCECNEIETIIVDFWQEGYNGPAENRPLPIRKVKDQCDLSEPRTVSVTLNVEETLRFNEERKGYVQFQARTYEGICYATKKREIIVYPVYDDSILDGEIVPTPGFDGTVILDGMSIWEV